MLDALRPDTPLIAMQAIDKIYYRGSLAEQVLFDINLTVQHGDCLAIMGSSGSGKSTLMHIMGLLDQRFSGSYCLNGVNIQDWSDDACAHARNTLIGFVFQQFYLLPRWPVYYNVALPWFYREPVEPCVLEEAIRSALRWVGMEAYYDAYPTALSGGQQQRVAIARALSGNPRLILADEPTGALDAKTTQEILDLFLGLQAAGHTVVLITHDDRVAARCQRVACLREGCLFEADSKVDGLAP